MNQAADSELLQAYAERQSEAAFSELVRRHIDFVFSAAVRMVRDPHLAEDVTQSTFFALAQNAAELTRISVLSPWLHRTARNLACNSIRSEVRRRSREQEAAVMNELLANQPDASWDEVAPHLDEALGELDQGEREAVMLRYFERKSAREMAEVLGISGEAAQKRVSRAVEHLGRVLASRGVGVGAGALALALSTQAVQAAPAGLAATISTAALASGAALSTATAAATKTIAMTTLQKTAICLTLTAAVGTGIYQAYDNAQLRRDNRDLATQQASLVNRVSQVERERDQAAHSLAEARGELLKLEQARTPDELLKLRGKVGSLQMQLAASHAATNATGLAKMMSDPAMREYIGQAMNEMIKRRYGVLFGELKLTPDQVERFVQTISSTYQQGVQKLASMQQNGAAGSNLQPAPSEQATLETQLRALLGDSGFARFKEYSGELPARTTVDLLNTQLGGSPLTEEQRLKLFQIVKAEPFELTHGITGDLDQAFFGPAAQKETYLAKIADSNQRVIQQAGAFLTQEQVDALNIVLANGITARVTQAAAMIPKQ